MEGDTLVRRYCDLFAFINLLINRSLFFSRVRDLDDKSEGDFMDVYFATKIVPLNDHMQKSVSEANNLISNRSEEAKRAYVSCWNISNIEDILLYKTYCGSDGLCVISSIDSIIKSINDYPNIKQGKVRYNQSFKTPDVSSILKSKQKYFQSENEYRFIISDHDLKEGNYGSHLEVSCDPEILIHNVILSPTMPEWKRKITLNLISKIYPNILEKIVNSNISLKP